MKRDTILIFEDNDIDRTILAELFRSDYKILEAANGKEGIALLNSNLATIAVVLLDNLMPEMDGFAVLEHVKGKNIINKIPFIMVTGERSPELEKRGYEYGIVSYITKPYQGDVVRQVVHNAIGWFQYKTQLELMVKKQNINIQKQNSVLRQQTKKLNHVNEILIDSLSNIVEFRNMESKQHIKRIREYSMCLGKSVMKLYPEYELTAEK
ncbi:MAG: response regulator, partial [Lachnospiraceae bacterium]|nr:response regulator [Lachnospiraceae bacterium]